jgi:hypothetical protein
MSEMSMVERVARAIHRQDFLSEEAAENSWEIDTELRMDMARAAIAALREPTPQMIGAAHEAGIASRVLPVWRAMIDEALR